MTDKLPVQAVGAMRYDTRGRDIEHVTISVNTIGNTVHLTVERPKSRQQYTMSQEAWHALEQAVPMDTRFNRG